MKLPLLLTPVVGMLGILFYPLGIDLSLKIGLFFGLFEKLTGTYFNYLCNFSVGRFLVVNILLFIQKKKEKEKKKDGGGTVGLEKI